MVSMTRHPHSQGDKHNVSVDIQVQSDFVVVRFNVESERLNCSDRFTSDGWVNEKLWNFDVVELFLTRQENGPYLELQVSPLSQKLALLIKKPREVVECYEPRMSSIGAVITDIGFSADFKIHHSDIPGHSNIVIGNTHACLGTTYRSYYSLFEGSDDVLDFHRPEFFQKLGEL